MRELRLVSGLCHVMTAPAWGVSHILWDPHFPLQDMAVIIPTSWDCWKIMKGDISCERWSRALARVEDSIDNVRIWLLFVEFTQEVWCYKEVETPFPISAGSGQGWLAVWGGALLVFFRFGPFILCHHELLILLLWNSALSLKWDTSYLLHKVTMRMKRRDAHRAINRSWYIESTQYTLTILLYHSLSTFV